MSEKQDNIICRCEEITEDVIRQAIREGCHDHDSIKRRTRAGMGMCQSKTCYNLVARLLREEGIEPDKIRPFTVQAPVRPISLSVLYNDDFDEESIFNK